MRHTCLSCGNCYFAADARAYCKIEDETMVMFHWIRREDVEKLWICPHWEDENERLPPALRESLERANKELKELGQKADT